MDEANKEQTVKEKQCYISFNEDFDVLYDNRYISVELFLDDEGIPCCSLAGRDDWEMNYAGPDAEDKFNALLELPRAVSYDEILALGFTQYG